MRINFFTQKLPQIKPICKKISNFLVPAKPKFLSEPATDRFEATILKPDFVRINNRIADDEEYKTILAKLKHSLNRNGSYAYFTYEDLKTYRKVDLIEHGLIPYCGYDDSSRLINMYLSGRLTEKELSDFALHLPYELDTIPEVIRVLEYSLNVLDKKYGQYSGIVYRQGFMSETPNQYLSTSINRHIAADLHHEWGYFTGKKKYSIIKVENGHRLVDFQKEAGTKFATSEQEILLPFRNEYKKLTDEELSKDLLDAKTLFASSLFKDADKLMSGSAKKINGYTVDDLWNMIDVYVQK